MVYDGSATQYIRRLIRILYEKEVELERLRQKSYPQDTQQSFNQEMRHTLSSTMQIRAQVAALEAKINTLEQEQGQEAAHHTQLQHTIHTLQQNKAQMQQKYREMRQKDEEMREKYREMEEKYREMSVILCMYETFSYEMSALVELAHAKYCKRSMSTAALEPVKRFQSVMMKFKAIVGEVEQIKGKEHSFRMDSVQGLSNIQIQNVVEHDSDINYTQNQDILIERLEQSIEMSERSKRNREEEYEEMEEKFKMIKEVNEQLFGQVNEKEITLNQCRGVVKNMSGKKQQINKLKIILGIQ